MTNTDLALSRSHRLLVKTKKANTYHYSTSRQINVIQLQKQFDNINYAVKENWNLSINSTVVNFQAVLWFWVDGFEYKLSPLLLVFRKQLENRQHDVYR